MNFGRIIHLINNIPLLFFVARSKKILDIGCGVHSPVNYFVRPGQQLDGVDISAHDVTLQSATKYREIFVHDVRTFFPPKPYDTVTALDFIEHLDKKEGVALLDRLENLAERRVIIVTPNGFVPQEGTIENPFQEHKSGWTVDDFQSRGYRIYGMFGPKQLRTATAILKYRPKLLWGIIDICLTPIYFFLPRSSFSLLAVYDHGKKQ